MAVGLQMPTAGRSRTRVQQALVALVMVGALLVLGGTALLLGAVAQEHPQLVYYA